MRLRLLSVTVLAALTARIARAADWPEWRGPNRDGVAPDSPRPIDAVSGRSLRKAWESDTIPGANLGGFGQVAVADRRAFVLVHERRVPALKERLITRDVLTRQGWFPGLPPQLAKAVEDARLSEARAKLRNQKDLLAWADDWLRSNLKPEWGKFQQPCGCAWPSAREPCPSNSLARSNPPSAASSPTSRPSTPSSGNGDSIPRPADKSSATCRRPRDRRSTGCTRSMARRARSPGRRSSQASGCSRPLRPRRSSPTAGATSWAPRASSAALT